MSLNIRMLHRALEFYQVCSSDYRGLILTYFMARSNLVSYAFGWQKVKKLVFSEAVVVYDI